MSTRERAVRRLAARSAARKRPAADAKAGAIRGRAICAARRTRSIFQLSCPWRRESSSEATTPAARTRKSGERTRLACSFRRPRRNVWKSSRWRAAIASTRGRPFDCRSGQAVRSPDKRNLRASRATVRIVREGYRRFRYAPNSGQFLRIRKKRRCAAGVPEQNGFVALEHAFANQIHQRAECTPGVNRVENDSFAARHQSNSLAFQIADDAVSFARVAVNNLYVLLGQPHVRADVLRAFVGNLRHFFFVGPWLSIVLVNGQSVQLSPEPRDSRAQHHTRLRAAGTRSEQDVIHTPLG